MPNVRVAQIGQTEVNHPIFEVKVSDRSYVARINDENKVEFVNPILLKNIGVYSPVVKQFYQPDSIVLTLFKTQGYTTIPDQRFPFQNLGSGLAFVPGFTQQKGFTSITPSNLIWLTL